MLPCQADLHYFDSRSHRAFCAITTRLIARSPLNILLALAHESQIQNKDQLYSFDKGSRKEQLLLIKV
jgi:hypothetical protein